jgi:Cu-Zn family superoxide dismutase
MKKSLLCATAFGIAAGAVHADYKVEMNSIDAQGVGPSIGNIVIKEGDGKGTVFVPDLKNLPPGTHGFHVHQAGSCGPKQKDGKMEPGEMAGPHWDPDKAGKHASPKGGGHRGDLPPLIAGDNGTARGRIVAPRLKYADLKGKSLMIHDGGDNFSDKPKPNGGGGTRIACGVIEPAAK